MSKKYDPWKSLRDAVSDTEDSIKHYKSDNYMQVVLLPADGIQIPRNSNSLSAHLGPCNIRNGDVIEFRSHKEANTTDIGRVVGIARTGGAGEVLDPPHLAVLVLSSMLQSAYFRLIHPQQLALVAEPNDIDFVRWFFSSSNAFDGANLNLFLKSMDYGTMTSRFFKQCINAAGDLIPPPGMSYYTPVFSRVNRYLGGGYKLRQAQHDFEVWLSNQNYVETDPSMGVTTASNMLEVYLEQTPTVTSERDLLEQLASIIGSIRKDE